MSKPKQEARKEGEGLMDTSVCVHCGLCLPACPTYQETGMESSSPRGRVFLLEAMARGAEPTPESVRQIDECLDCRACEEVCPAHVPVGHRVDEFRRAHPAWIQRGGRGRNEVRITRWLTSPRGLKSFQWIVRLSQRPGWRGLSRRWLPDPVKSLSLGLPRTIPKRLGRERWRPSRDSCPRDAVGLFLGCVMDAVFASTNHHTADLIADAGCSVEVPWHQRCCGALSFHGGDVDQARRLAAANIEAFASVPTVVVNAAGCGAFLKEYGQLFEASSPEQARAQALADRVTDVHQFFESHPLPELKPRAAQHLRLTIHDACHLAHAQGVRQPLRDLLSRAGYQIVEMAEADRCCGSAGTYNLSHPAMAERLKRAKVADVPNLVEGLATSNPGCMLQIQAGLEEQGRCLPVAHTMDWLWEAYHGVTP